MEEDALESLGRMLETIKPYSPPPTRINEPEEKPWEGNQEGEYEIRRRL